MPKLDSHAERLLDLLARCTERDERVLVLQVSSGSAGVTKRVNDGR